MVSSVRALILLSRLNITSSIGRSIDDDVRMLRKVGLFVVHTWCQRGLDKENQFLRGGMFGRQYI